MRASECRQRNRGMTLVEVMVALALLSLLSVGLISSFRIGEHTYRQVTRAAASDRDLVSAQRFLRQVLESAYPFQPSAGGRTPAFGLEGTATQLMLTAPMPQAAGASGNYRYELAVETTDHSSKNLIVRWVLDRNGAPAFTTTAATGAPHEEILIQGIQTLEWAYLEPADLNGVSGAREPRWLSSWTGHRKLPALVRLRLAFPVDDSRRWPELLVAPRVTDDSNCQFDIVAQACRETQS